MNPLHSPNLKENSIKLWEYIIYSYNKDYKFQ